MDDIKGLQSDWGMRNESRKEYCTKGSSLCYHKSYQHDGMTTGSTEVILFNGSPQLRSRRQFMLITECLSNGKLLLR